MGNKRVNCNTCNYQNRKEKKCGRFNLSFDLENDGWNPENRVCDYWKEHLSHTDKNINFRDVVKESDK